MSRAACGSMRPYPTTRSATIGTPYRVTFSCAIAEACFEDQCGAEYERLTTCAPVSSAQAGSIRAAMRPHSREVSTSSATIT